MNRDFADTAALLSDSARASMLLALLDGLSLPAGQLALIANVAPQTASSHLSKLVEGNILAVEQQGRHRYYRLAGTEVAQAIEALLAITPRPNRRPVQNRATNIPDGTLAYARTCYSHLAGRLAVEIADSLVQRELLLPCKPRNYTLTKRGREWFEAFGVSVPESQLKHSRFARQCLDWTERRHHIAGELGAALLAKLRELKWIAPRRGSRALRVTLDGGRRLRERLGVRAVSG